MLLLDSSVDLCVQNTNYVLLFVRNFLVLTRLLLPLGLLIIGLFFLVKWLRNKNEKKYLKRMIIFFVLAVATLVVLVVAEILFYDKIFPYNYDNDVHCWVAKD